MTVDSLFLTEIIIMNRVIGDAKWLAFLSKVFTQRLLAKSKKGRENVKVMSNTVDLLQCI